MCALLDPLEQQENGEWMLNRAKLEFPENADLRASLFQELSPPKVDAALVLLDPPVPSDPLDPLERR